MTDHNHEEIDVISGVATTGHDWDGLKELNNPTPRWWLWVFYVCIIFSIGYWVVYPAWPVPGGATRGMAGWTSQSALRTAQAEVFARQDLYLQRFHGASFRQIMDDPSLYEFAKAGGAAAFKDNCATCHGTGGTGGKGYPNLNDDDWLWGGKIDDIYQTLQYGIRSGHIETRLSLMPAFGRDKLLTAKEIDTIADYVLRLHEGKNDISSDGAQIFQKNCASCHGTDARGGREFGAPNLTNNIWLYGGDRATIIQTINNGRNGVMPYWKGRLNDDTLRELAVYVHELGGGEESETAYEPDTTPEPAIDGAPHAGTGAR